LLRLLRRDLFKKLKFSLMASRLSFGCGANITVLKRSAGSPLLPSSDPETAFIAFTSGATGTPKGVPFTLAMVEAQLAIFKGMFKIEAGHKDLPLLPVFALFNLALGAATVFPPMDPAKPLTLDPAQIVKMLNDLEIRTSFGAPTLWAKIAEHGIATSTTLPHLRQVFMAGAPVPERTLLRVQEVIPSGAVSTPYGATEALPATLVAAREVLSLSPRRANGGELGTLLGKAVPGVDLRVIAIAAHRFDGISETTLLGPGEIGEVIVHGANVSHSYFNRPEATALSKIRDGETLWHRMGDLGYLDEAGHLYFCGRKAHLVKTMQRTYYTEPIERVVNAHPKVRRSALIAVPWTSEPVIVIEPFPEFWPRSRKAKVAFAKELRSFAAADMVTPALHRFHFHPSLPVDPRHNAKILREKLSGWATRRQELLIEDDEVSRCSSRLEGGRS
jgi:acyl-CoA synthetase (AMP-forming)/AMP-acid ligase II